MQNRYFVLKGSPDGRRRSGGFLNEANTNNPTTRPDLVVESISNNADLEALRADPEVEYITPVLPICEVKPLPADGPQTAATGNITWGLRASGVLDSPRTGAGLTVAVLDSGINAGHPAFAGVNIEEKDFTKTGNGDTTGHGTHCAGTIFGREVGGVRFGVAPGIKKAFIGKVLGGSAGTDAVIDALNWAERSGAQIISMSLEIDFPGYVRRLIEDQGEPVDYATSKALHAYRDNIALVESAVKMLYQFQSMGRGALVVAASGNQSKRDVAPEYDLWVAPPAAAPGVFSVGAAVQTDLGGKLSVADFSNIGQDITGPGVNILSANKDGGLIRKSGTSMATPHVAGLAALWAEKLIEDTGKLRLDQLRSKLISTAKIDLFEEGTQSVRIGAGLAQAPRS